jgi:hypothetical protein
MIHPPNAISKYAPDTGELLVCEWRNKLTMYSYRKGQSLDLLLR